MLKIWFVNHFAVSPDQPGGTRHFDFAVELVKNGNEVCIFASDFSYQHRKYIKLPKGKSFIVENFDGVKYIWVRAMSYQINNWRRALNMVSFAFNALRVGVGMDKPDLIVGSTPHLFAALSGYLLSVLKNTKFVLEVRDLWPQVLIDMGEADERSFMVKALRLLERFLYKRADKIIVLAGGSIKYLKRCGVPEDKIIFIPNGIHRDHMRPTMGRDLARQKFCFDKFTLVYSGAHGPANALQTILEGAKDLMDDRNIEFVLLGDGPEKNKLRRYAIEKKITNVRFLDPLPKNEIPDFLAAADVGVITLKNNDLFKYGVSPNKLFDYMASALPVICCIGGDMGELVVQAGAGISVPAEDSKAFAKAVIEIYNMPKEKRGAVGQNGRNYVLSNHLREKQVKKLEDLFNNLCVR